MSWLVKRIILFLIAKWASFDIHNHNCFFFQKNNEFPNDVYAMGTMIVGATMEVKMKLSLTLDLLVTTCCSSKRRLIVIINATH